MSTLPEPLVSIIPRVIGTALFKRTEIRLQNLPSFFGERLDGVVERVDTCSRWHEVAGFLLSVDIGGDPHPDGPIAVVALLEAEHRHPEAVKVDRGIGGASSGARGRRSGVGRREPRGRGGLALLAGVHGGLRGGGGLDDVLLGGAGRDEVVHIAVAII